MPLFGKKTEKKPFCSAIICAAGASTRMGQDKTLLTLDGKPVIVNTLEVFQSCAAIDEIILVTRPESIEVLSGLREKYSLDKVSKIVAGGDTRAKSVIAGLSNAAKSSEIIAVHDGARPFVTVDIIESAVSQAEKYGSAVAAIMPKDTIKQEADGKVHMTLPRPQLRLVQTPQVFQKAVLSAALSNLDDDTAITDDAMAVEKLGLPVFFVDGSEENIKITTPFDMVLARAILDWRNGN